MLAALCWIFIVIVILSFIKALDYTCKPNDFPKDEKSKEPADGGLSDFKADYGEETPPKSKPKNLNEYVSENRDILFAIFDTYLEITDDEVEKEVIAEVKRFIN